MGNPDSEERGNLSKQDLASKPQQAQDSYPDLSEATICPPEHYMPPTPTPSSFSLNIERQCQLWTDRLDFSHIPRLVPHVIYSHDKKKKNPSLSKVCISPIIITQGLCSSLDQVRDLCNLTVESLTSCRYSTKSY